MNPYPPVVLASASPRRRRMLAAAGLDCRFVAADVAEAESHPASPRALAQFNASLKADAVAEALSGSGNDSGELLIVAADTIVVLGGDVLGKPRDRAHARATLSRLSGATHEVITGIALRLHPRGTTWIDAERTAVTFHPLSPESIAAYVETGDADDKAGAYGIQGAGGAFIANVDGDLANVIGLPLARLGRAFAELAGADPFAALDRRALVAAAFPEQSPAFLRWVH